MIKHTIRDCEDINWDMTFNSLKGSGKPYYLGSEMSQIAHFSGKFLNCGKSASIKLLPNIMSALSLHRI